MKTHYNSSRSIGTGSTTQRHPGTTGLLTMIDNRLSSITQRKMQTSATAFLGKTIQRVSANGIAAGTSAQPVAQRLLMNKLLFKSRKKDSTNSKKFGLISLERSTKDYDKLYDSYHNFLKKENYEKANQVLLEIKQKVDRMANKNIGEGKYWKSHEEKASFLEEALRGIKEEESNLKSKWLLLLGESTAFYFSRNVYSNGSDEAHKQARAKQRYQLVEEIVLKLANNGEIEWSAVANEDFFQYLSNSCSELTTYTEIYNAILSKLIGGSSATVEALIAKIKNNNSLTEEEKVVEIAKILTGSFTWYVNSDDINERDAEQLDEFILWATNQQEAEPTGAAKMNCWEGIIFAMYKAGVITKETITSKYEGHKPEQIGVNQAFEVVNKAAIKNNFWYRAGERTGNEPASGDIIYCWESLSDAQPHHLVLALGNGECMSLWNSTCGFLGRTTLNSLLTGNITAITFARQPWK